MKAIEIKQCNGYVLRIDFTVCNSGAAFARNDYGHVYATICHWDENYKYIEDLHVECGRARDKVTADKVGRQYIREHDLRAVLVKIASGEAVDLPGKKVNRRG